MNCIWFLARGYKLLVFLGVVSLCRGKGAANQEAPASIQGDIIHMNGDKIIPQNSPIGIAVTDAVLDLFLHCTTCRWQWVLSCKMST